MTGEFFFLTFGGLGISIAGFAGLIFALGYFRDPDDPISKWRVKNIATNGLTIAQLGLVMFPIFYFTDSMELTVRIVSGVGFLAVSAGGWAETRHGPAWPDERRRRFVLGIGVLIAAAWLLNVFLGSVPLLMLGFVAAISGAIGTFMNAILEIKIDMPDDDSSDRSPPTIG